MNDKLYIIDMRHTAEQEQITCEVCAVGQDGSLIAFNIENGQPVAVKGYAPTAWIKFSRSTIRVN